MREREKEGENEREGERERERKDSFARRVSSFAVYRVHSLVGEWPRTNEPRLVFESSVSFALFEFGFEYLFFFDQ